MAFLVIHTKTVAPPLRSGLVPRKQIFALLNESANHRLILIHAPAGYGKSTIISAWAQASTQRYAWFSIDKGDNNPAQFLTYLITTVQSACPGLGLSLLGLLNKAGDVPTSSIVAALINDLANLAARMTIILDDYHLIENQEIHEAIIFLLDHIPPSVQLVIISRSEPPFPLHRWRGRGELAEIRATDLRFTFAETQTFLHRAMGLELNHEEVQILEKRTEGWVAGLQMAGLAIKTLPVQTDAEQTTISDFVHTFSSNHRYILDYLRDEVIHHQPSNVRDFLLRTSILKEMSASLCNAVLQIENSQAILDHLENQNLFLIPLDGERQWYRYHHLFAELLQNSLQQEFTEDLSTYHLRASQWYAQNKDASQAIDHALLSKQTDEIITLAEKFVLDLYEHGDPDQSRHWIGRLPVEMIRSRPLLCMAQSIASTYTHPFDYQRAENWAAQAQKTGPELLDQPVHRAGIPYATIGDLVMAYAARFRITFLRLRGGTPGEILRAAEQALAITPEGDYAARSSLWMATSRAHLSLGEADAAEQAIQQAIALGEISGKQSMLVSAFWTQAYIAYWQGRLKTALAIYQRTYQEYICPAEQRGEYLSSASVLYTFWGTLLMEMNQLDEAERLFLKSQDSARFRDLADTALDNEIGLAWLAAYRGKDDGIRDLEERLPALPAKKGEMVQRHTAGMKLLLGDRQPEWADAVFHWANEQVLHLKPLERLESTYLTWVQALLLRRHWGKSIPDLNGVLEPLQIQQHLAEEGHFLRAQIQVLMIQALVYQALDEMEPAVQTIGRAVRLAQPEGYARIFINERAPIIPLLLRTLEQGIAPGYVQDLLYRLKEADVSDGSVIAPTRPCPPLIESLTPREQEVLELVAAGLSNQQIAAQLVLAPGTVKKYLRSVFQKLDVSRRTQAVARSRQLGIL